MIQEAARLTLERLREVGWSPQGAYGPDGEECVVVAFLHVLRPTDYRALSIRIQQRTGYRLLSTWNNDPDTTWQDVERVLTEIAES